METIERIDEWREGYRRWRRVNEVRDDDLGHHYPFVENEHAPFKPLGRALPMLNLALITSAGAYIDGTQAFDTTLPGGDASFREIPVEVVDEDLRWSVRGYDPRHVERDMNSQVPLARLAEFAGNGIIGQLNPVFWSFCGFIPNAARLVDDSLPQLVERIKRYEVQAALLIPASALCHQSMALAARALEAVGVPTMLLAVDKAACARVRPPRAAYYRGKLGGVAGRARWPEHQRRILDESLRVLESLDHPTTHNLSVEIETLVEKGRGEK